MWLALATPPPPGAGRWLALAVIGLLSFVLARILRAGAGSTADRRTRRAVCWTLGAALLAGIAFAQLYRIQHNIWTLAESLPLHLCDIAVFVVAATLFGAGAQLHVSRRWQRLYELAFIWGLGGTFQAVITPDIDDRTITTDCLRYFILHGGILVGVLVLTFGLGLRLTPGTPQRVWLATLLLAVVIFAINQLLGANYMYLSGPPRHPSLIDLMVRIAGPWPRYLLPLTILATGLIYLCYLPFWLAARLRDPDTPRPGAPRS